MICRSFFLLGVMLLLLSAISCQAGRSEPPAVTTAPSASTTKPATQTFEDKKAGVRFQYPAGWMPEKAQTAVFDVAAAPGSIKGYAALSLDIPKLPPHIPGMITPGMVAGGYIDDLKKNEIHDAKVEENVDTKVPGAPARRVKCSGHENGKPAIDVAMIIIHNDRVYILSCDSDNDGYDVARAALDAAVASIEWIK